MIVFRSVINLVGPDRTVVPTRDPLRSTKDLNVHIMGACRMLFQSQFQGSYGSSVRGYGCRRVYRVRFSLLVASQAICSVTGSGKLPQTMAIMLQCTDLDMKGGEVPVDVCRSPGGCGVGTGYALVEEPTDRSICMDTFSLWLP